MVSLFLTGGPRLDALYESARTYDKKAFHFRVPDDGPLRRMQTLVARVVRALQPGSPPALLVTAARGVGLELGMARDAGGDLWVLHEPAGRRDGDGLYAFRPEGNPLCIQAPHTFHEDGTGEIALALFARLRAGTLFVNTVHRYARSHGGYSAADVAHAERTMFAAATHGLLDAARRDIVQVHGFGDGHELPTSVKAVLSDGVSVRPPHAPAERLRAALTARWGADTVRLFGVDATVLGATTNIEGKAVRAAGGAFLHVELSRPARMALAEDVTPLGDALAETLARPRP